MDIYLSRNFNEAAYLLSKKHKLERIDSERNTKTVFLFEIKNNEALDNDIAEFNNNLELHSYLKNGIDPLRRKIFNYKKIKKHYYKIHKSKIIK